MLRSTLYLAKDYKKIRMASFITLFALVVYLILIVVIVIASTCNDDYIKNI